MSDLSAPSSNTSDGQVAYRAELTCGACPTQYDIHLADGRYAYFRYRHGYVSLTLWVDQQAFWDGEPLAEWGMYRGDKYDGEMAPAEAEGLIADRLPTLLAEAQS